MKVSVIIPLYKDLKSLKIVLEAFQRQTYQNFELIVTEDDDSSLTVEFLKKFKDLKIIHLQQPDTGRNKVIAQNRAIVKSNGEYLIFIDGDIVPFKHFIEYSVALSKPKRVLSGRRVNLPQAITEKIKKNIYDICGIEKHYFKFLWQNKSSRDVRVEQGVQLNPNTWFYTQVVSKRKRNSEILGCNFSCFKEDIIAINGFDEEYHPLATLADDTDLTWRFKGMGYELLSSKNIVNCFHLWHERGSSNTSFNPQNDIKLFEYKKKNQVYVCKDGLDKYLKDKVE